MMHLSFRVVLAAVAALTSSMAVSAHSECLSIGSLCESKPKDCCKGSECIVVYDLRFDEVSMSNFIQDLLTSWHRSLTGHLNVN